MQQVQLMLGLATHNQLGVISRTNADLPRSAKLDVAQTGISRGSTKPDADRKSQGHRMRVHQTDIHRPNRTRL
ncbi:unnamed protein product [Linum trigynum]|uniref:Uncharacterized protein n=1 Tax=Linum trigynum TaxID=586398 RepID=A0AAV2F8B2_9ROSI